MLRSVTEAICDRFGKAQTLLALDESIAITCLWLVCNYLHRVTWCDCMKMDGRGSGVFKEELHYIEFRIECRQRNSNYLHILMVQW